MVYECRHKESPLRTEVGWTDIGDTVARLGVRLAHWLSERIFVRSNPSLNYRARAQVFVSAVWGPGVVWDLGVYKDHGTQERLLKDEHWSTIDSGELSHFRSYNCTMES